MDSLIDLWGKRNPRWEKRFENELLRCYADYSRGTNQYQDARGKVYGAGYEILIVAFFIGLYSKQTKPLNDDAGNLKTLGQPIQYWGNIEARMGRKSYGKIREYMFAALVANTEIDFLRLDKGEMTEREAVDILIDKMEQYINYGLYYMSDRVEQNANHYYKEGAFMNDILDLVTKEEHNVNVGPESLE